MSANLMKLPTRATFRRPWIAVPHRLLGHYGLGQGQETGLGFFVEDVAEDDALP